jgi:hypothetical protein
MGIRWNDFSVKWRLVKKIRWNEPEPTRLPRVIVSAIDKELCCAYNLNHTVESEKNSLFFHSNEVMTISGSFFFFQKNCNKNIRYSWKNSSFQRFFSFSDEFPLLTVIKTIHSEFRGNLPLKTDKIVMKWRDFYQTLKKFDVTWVGNFWIGIFYGFYYYLFKDRSI